MAIFMDWERFNVDVKEFLHKTDAEISDFRKAISEAADRISKEARVRTVTLYEVIIDIGFGWWFDEYPDYVEPKFWGWTPNNPELHLLFEEELRPSSDCL